MKRNLKIISILAITVMLLISNYAYGAESFSKMQEKNELENVQSNNDEVENSISSDEYGVVPISLDDESRPVVNAENNINNSTAYENDNENEVNYYVDEETGRTTIADDKYDASQSTKKYSNMKINGNVFAVNKEMVSFSNSEINGNVFITASDVELDNVTVNGSLFVCSKNLVINNTTIQSIYGFSQETKIDKYSLIMYDIRIAGETANIEGKIKRDLYISAENVSITSNAIIGRNAKIEGKNLEIEKSSIIGKLEQKINNTENEKNKSINYKKYIISKIMQVIVVVLLALLVVNIIPTSKNKDSQKIRISNYIKSFFIGILSIIVLTIMVIILFAIGVPTYACALLFMLMTCIVLGKFAFIIITGLGIANRMKNETKASKILIIALLEIILEIISMLSLAGNVGMSISTIINTIIVLSGLGLIFMNMLSKKNTENTKKNIKNEKESINTIDENKNEEK